MLLGQLLTLTLALSQRFNVTSLIDYVTRNILEPSSSESFMSSNKYKIIRSDSAEIEREPENIFIMEKFIEADEIIDYSSESTSEATTDYTTDFTTETTEKDDILEMTANYHQMRVKLANLNYTIESQQKLIASLSQKVQDLENIVTHFKAENETNRSEVQKCERDRDALKSEVKAVKRFITMEKYSRGLKKMFKEFKIDESIERQVFFKLRVRAL